MSMIPSISDDGCFKEGVYYTVECAKISKRVYTHPINQEILLEWHNHYIQAREGGRKERERSSKGEREKGKRMGSWREEEEETGRKVAWAVLSKIRSQSSRNAVILIWRFNSRRKWINTVMGNIPFVCEEADLRSIVLSMVLMKSASIRRIREIVRLH